MGWRLLTTTGVGRMTDDTHTHHNRGRNRFPSLAQRAALNPPSRTSSRNGHTNAHQTTNNTNQTAKSKQRRRRRVSRGWLDVLDRGSPVYGRTMPLIAPSTKIGNSRFLAREVGQTKTTSEHNLQKKTWVLTEHQASFRVSLIKGNTTV